MRLRVNRRIIACTAICIIPLLASACLVIPVGGTRDGSDFRWTPSAAELASARDGIRENMTTSATAWSNGDLDKFMDSYEPDSAPTYITKNAVIRGRAAIRERYAPRFAAGASHGTLTFSNVEIDLMAPGVANIIAMWHLANPDGTSSSGWTTVVMRRHNNAWRIVHDHSS